MLCQAPTIFFLTGSLGILSEAGHSLIDLGATVMTYAAVRVSGTPPDEEHHYGHEKFEAVSARPDLNILYGYKRTQLADTSAGVNTALAGVQVTLPITDRNQGNRAAANAEVNRQQQLLAAAQASVLADYYGAFQEYQLRRNEMLENLQPLREHATEISEIAQGAYTQGGTDLLRLLDAERARLEAELAYVQGMVEYQQSIVNLEAAEGVAK